MDCMLASISDATWKQYEFPLKLWWKFSLERNISFFDPKPTAVLEFLANRVDHVNKYGTINSYRSEISLLTGNELGNHPSMKRFCKGVSVLKPQTPRYSFTWNPKPVLDYLSSLFPLSGLSLKDLSIKLVTLLSLTTGHRQQTLASMELPNIHFNTQGGVITVPKKIKTSAPGRKQPCFVLPFFPSDKSVCVASTLQYYIEKTQSLRTQEEEALFLTFNSPHRPCSTQTLSRWIGMALSKGGIDTDVFKPYSTRHAATSAAARQGISVDEIRKAATWTKESETFARHYDRPLAPETNFSISILNLHQ